MCRHGYALPQPTLWWLSPTYYNCCVCFLHEWDKMNENNTSIKYVFFDARNSALATKGVLLHNMLASYSIEVKLKTLWQLSIWRKIIIKKVDYFLSKNQRSKKQQTLLFKVIWSDAEIVLQCSLMTDVGSNDQQLAPPSDCASLTVHNTTTPFAQLFDLCCKNIGITCLTQPPVTNHPRLEAGVQCHLGVIFTAFFVPWLDGWQGHSGWIVKWPPEKVLNSLRLPATLCTLC